MHYSSSEKTKLPYIYGVFSDYDGSGYVVDYAVQTNQTHAALIVKNLMANSFIDQSTRAIMIGTLYFEPNRRLFCDTLGLFELSPLKVQDYTDYISVFKLNYLDDPEVYEQFLIDVAILTLALLVFSTDVMTHVLINKDRKRAWNYLINLKFLLNLLIICMLISYMAIFYKVPDISLEAIINYPDYLDLHEYATNYDFALKMKAMAFIICSFKFLFGLNFNTQMVFFFRLLQKSLKDILAFLFFYFLILIGLAIMMMQYFGLYVLEFTNFTQAFVTLFSILSLGDKFDQNQLNIVNRTYMNFVIVAFTLFILVIYTGYLLSSIQENVRYIMTYESSLFERETLTDILIKYYNMFLKNVKKMTDKIKRKIFKAPKDDYDFYCATTREDEEVDSKRKLKG